MRHFAIQGRGFEIFFLPAFLVVFPERRYDVWCDVVSLHQHITVSSSYRIATTIARGKRKEDGPASPEKPNRPLQTPANTTRPTYGTYEK